MKDVPAFSPFSPAMIWEKRNRGLLLQFLASELIASHHAICVDAPYGEIVSLQKRYFPYDWAYPYGYLNKAHEHALMMNQVFPEVEGRAAQLQDALAQMTHSQEPPRSKKTIIKQLQKIFLSMEPFIERCKDNENLIFFLLQHREEIDQLVQENYLCTLLLKLHPHGLMDLGEKLCDNYHHRGFYFLIPQLKLLLAKIDHAQ